MADDDRGPRRDGGRERDGGRRDGGGRDKKGQGGGAPKLSVSGTRKALTLHVSFYKNGIGQTEDFRIWLGNEADPCLAIMADASSTTTPPADALISVRNGEGWYRGDFSTIDPKTYDRVGIKTRGGQEIVKPILADDPATEHAKTAPKKNKRIKLFCEGRELCDCDCIPTYSTEATIRIETSDKDGKPSQELVYVTAGWQFTLKDRAGNVLAAAPGTTPAIARDVQEVTLKTPDTPVKGSQFAVVDMTNSTDARPSLDFAHPESRETMTLSFHRL